MSELIIISLFIIQVAIVAFRPKWGVYLIAALLPVIGRDFYIYGFLVPAADLVALGTLFAFTFNYSYRLLFKATEDLKLKWPLFFPFFLFLVISAISIILNGNSLSSWYYFLRWPLFLYFAYIFVPANIISDAKTLKRTVLIVSASAIAVLISGFLSLIGQDWQHSFFRLKSIYVFNSFPFGENHNLVAEFLNIGAFFVLVIKEFLKSKKGRRLADALFLVFALGIVLTFSRTGWITLFLQSAVYIYFRLKHFPKQKMATATLLLVLVAIATPLFFKMNSLQADNVSSTENRVILTEIAWEAFLDKPLLGQGSGTFVGLVEDNVRFSAKYGAPVDSHGVIQKVAAENGIFGLLSWLFILLFLLRFCYIAISKYYPKVPWVLPFALAAMGGIFFQFFNTSYYKGKVWFPLILFLLAISLSEKIYVKKDKSSPYPSQLK